MQRELDERFHLVKAAMGELDDRMVVPTCNLNGSSAERLVELNRDVLDAWRELHNKLSAATPHGRDYQLQPAGTYGEMNKAWHQRRTLLEYLRKEFETLTYSIADQRK